MTSNEEKQLVLDQLAAGRLKRREFLSLDRRRMGITAGKRHQDRDRPAKRRDLGQREVDEDDASLDNVNTEIGVNAGQNEAGGEWRRQERECR